VVHDRHAQLDFLLRTEDLALCVGWSIKKVSAKPKDLVNIVAAPQSLGSVCPIVTVGRIRGHEGTHRRKTFAISTEASP
jgi:hypothetical protein